MGKRKQAATKPAPNYERRAYDLFSVASEAVADLHHLLESLRQMRMELNTELFRHVLMGLEARVHGIREKLARNRSIANGDNPDES